jgi:hypothetical protein
MISGGVGYSELSVDGIITRAKPPFTITAETL